MSKASDVKELARNCGVLADRTRLTILDILSSGPKNVTAICKALGKKQPAVSHHLGILRMGRAVTTVRKSRSIIYSTNPAALKDLAAAITGLAPRK